MSRSQTPPSARAIRGSRCVPLPPETSFELHRPGGLYGLMLPDLCSGGKLPQGVWIRYQQISCAGPNKKPPCKLHGTPMYWVGFHGLHIDALTEEMCSPVCPPTCHRLYLSCNMSYLFGCAVSAGFDGVRALPGSERDGHRPSNPHHWAGQSSTAHSRICRYIQILLCGSDPG